MFSLLLVAIVIGLVKDDGGGGKVMVIVDTFLYEEQ